MGVLQQICYQSATIVRTEKPIIQVPKLVFATTKLLITNKYCTNSISTISIVNQTLRTTAFFFRWRLSIGELVTITATFNISGRSRSPFAPHLNLHCNKSDIFPSCKREAAVSMQCYLIYYSGYRISIEVISAGRPSINPKIILNL